MNIGQFATNLILNTTLNNQEILDKVLEKFPSANTKLASIAWYRSQSKKEVNKVVVQVRTIDVIKNEIDELTVKLLELESELEQKVQEEEKTERELFEMLKKKFEKVEEEIQE